MTIERASKAVRPSVTTNVLVASVAWVVAGVVYVLARGRDTEFAMFWVFGLAFGFVLQRARF